VTSASEELEDLFENAPCGYLTLVPDGRISRVNQTLCDWTGYPREQFAGKRLHQFLNMAGRIYFETHIAPLLRMQGFFSARSTRTLLPSSTSTSSTAIREGKSLDASETGSKTRPRVRCCHAN